MKSISHQPINYPEKIIALWTVFLFGMLFHTQLALMPLFHGMDVAESHTHEFMELSSILWLMLGFFMIPLVAIVITAFNQSKGYRIFHWGLSLFYTVNNILHFVLDWFVKVPSYQLFLMAFLVGIGLLLNLVSYQWMRNYKTTAPSDYFPANKY
jgi:glucan phosphoethanolaminetransferase (alkaline phosphatase superfamily)